MREESPQLFFFTFHAQTTDQVAHPDPDITGCAGAYVNCYVHFKNQWGAEQLARLVIETEGWIITDLELVQHVTRADLEDEQSREYFDEAIAEGWSLVFHTYASIEGDEAS